MGIWGFPGASAGEESVCNLGDEFNPWVGKIPWRRAYPLQYSCLENSMDGGAWQATVHEVRKRQTQLSDFHFSLGRATASSLYFRKLIMIGSWIPQKML